MPSKNIPVNGWPQIKELDIVAPILAELDKIEAWQKSVKQETKTGAEVTFTNALALAAVTLSAEIEASQDLHGQSAPYVGGAGKNKLPMTVSGIKALNTGGTWTDNVYVYNGVTFTILTDATNNITGIRANGTTSALTEFSIYRDLDNSCPFINDILNGCTGGGGDTYMIRVSDLATASANCHNGDTTIDITASGKWSCQIHIKANITLSNQIFYPMIRLASVSDPTFAPYSNICPISGRTAVTITDVDAESQTATVTVQLGQTVYGGSLNVTTGELTIDHAIVDMGTMEWTAQTTNTENIYRMNSKSIKSVIDYPDSFTVSGGLICEWYADKTARETYQKNVGVSVDNVGEIFVYDENYNTSSSATVFTTFISGCHLCYKLKTPTTIQLTPEQLTMLKGYNRLSSDGGGDITVTAYTGNKWN